MSTFAGALLREQGVSFALVMCRRGSSESQKRQLMTSAAPLFGGVPVVAVEQDNTGRPTYYGRTDLVRFLASVPFAAIPWKRFTVS
jgi:hypothetical protein